MKNPKFEAILYKEMLPLVLKVSKNHKINITAERWNELKPFVTFRKVLKEEEIEISGQYIILTEGSMSTEETTYEPGSYDMTKEKVKVRGPAKVFYSNSSFEQELSDKKTIGELMSKASVNRPRMSSQKRSTLVGAEHGGDAFTRSPFMRD